MPKRPHPVTVGPLSCTVVRGPREKDGRWYWRIRHAETPHGCAWATRDEIEQLAARRLVDPQAKPPSDEVVTVRDLLEVYLGHLTGRSPAPAPRSIHTWAATSRALGAELDAVRVDRLDLVTLDAYVSRRSRAGCRKRGEVGRGIASLTIRRELDYLARAWGWARARGHVPARDLALPEIHARPETERHTPSPGDVGATLPHLPLWAARCVRVLYATGLRIGELAALHREHVEDLGDGWARLRVDGKTGPRDVVVGGAVAAELLGLPAGALTRYAPLSLSTLLPIALRAACSAAGVAPYTPHGLRRLAVDRLYLSGADPATAGALLGHSAEVALGHYRRVREADTLAAAKAARMGDLPPAGDVLAFRRPS